MQPIERYGLVALVFLGITITAACLWEPEEDPAAPAAPGAAAERVARAADRPTPNAGGRDFVGARSSPTQRAKPKALSAEQRQELLALQGRHQEADPARGASAQAPDAARAALADAIAARQADGVGAAEVLRALERPEAAETPRAEHRRAEPASAETPRTAEAAGRRVYTIRASDTLSEIASAELGTWKRWQEIVDLNPGLDPNKLREGARIVLPADGPARAAASTAPKAREGREAAAPAGSVHVVRENESLWKIAAARLGSGERWGEIAKLNPSIDPNRLSPGMKLTLPPDAGGAKASAPARDGGAVAQAASDERKGRVR
jgi:nucleoid-associated protein YgaU